MKTFVKIIIFLATTCVVLAQFEEPIVVRATVANLRHIDDMSPKAGPDILGSPHVWETTLVIDEVLSGHERLTGSIMYTFTATSQPDGNLRVVTPKLSVGDTGIWAIKRLTNGKLHEVYTSHEVENNVCLPLIKGRHDAYSRVLGRLSGGVTEPKSPPDQNVQQDLVKPFTDPSHRAAQPTDEKNAPLALPKPSQTVEKVKSSIPWNYIVVFVVVAFALMWLLLKRRS